MSYIRMAIRCNNCKHEMNVSVGTFGGGIPHKCPQCGKEPMEFEEFKDTWTFTNPTTGEQFEY